MSKVIPFPIIDDEPALFAGNIMGVIWGKTKGEDDCELSIYVARFFGSEYIPDGTVHIGIHDNSTTENVTCAISLTPEQAHELALNLLKGAQ